MVCIEQGTTVQGCIAGAGHAAVIGGGGGQHGPSAIAAHGRITGAGSIGPTGIGVAAASIASGRITRGVTSTYRCSSYVGVGAGGCTRSTRSLIQSNSGAPGSS